METRKKIIESIANQAHESWSGWMKYLFRKSTINDDGSITIPRKLAERWERQMHTPYSKLPENEKESDRNEADEYLTIFSGHLNALFKRRNAWDDQDQKG